jgi:hypothetical protein
MTLLVDSLYNIIFRSVDMNGKILLVVDGFSKETG